MHLIHIPGKVNNCGLEVAFVFRRSTPTPRSNQLWLVQGLPKGILKPIGGGQAVCSPFSRETLAVWHGSGGGGQSALQASSQQLLYGSDHAKKAT